MQQWLERPNYLVNLFAFNIRVILSILSAGNICVEEACAYSCHRCVTVM
jgi:hypothetical protein